MRHTYELWDKRTAAATATQLLTPETAAELNEKIAAEYGADAPLHWRLQGAVDGAGGSVTGAAVIDYRQRRPGEVIRELTGPVKVYDCPNCRKPGVLRLHGEEQRMSHVEAQFSGGREYRVFCAGGALDLILNHLGTGVTDEQSTAAARQMMLDIGRPDLADEIDKNSKKYQEGG